MKYFAIKDPIYNNNLNLYFDCSVKEMEKHIRKHLKIDDLELPEQKNASGRFTLIEKGSHYYYCLWVGKFDWYIAEQALLSHEVLHYVFESLNNAGVKLTDESEEAFTYYYQMTYANVLRKLQIKHHKVKKKRKRK